MEHGLSASNRFADHFDSEWSCSSVRPGDGHGEGRDAGSAATCTSGDSTFTKLR